MVFDPEFDAKHADPHAELAEGLEERLLCLGADKDTTDKVVRFVAADDGTWDTDNELPDRQKARDALIQQARRTPRFLSNIIRAYLLNDAPTAKLPEDLVRLADDGSFRIKDVYGYARNIITLHGMISPAGATAGYIRLREILDHLTVGMSLKAEFGSDPSLAAAITHIVDGAVQRVEPGSQISRFQERRFNNARAVARAIESKERTFDDLLNLLTKKKRFSAWLQEQKLDQDLFDAFMGEMCAGSWIERLTPKSLRFILFSGGGVLADLAITATTGIPGVGTAAGFSLGAFDTFLIAKLGENWNPHQFVNGPLAQFVSPQVHSSGR